MKTATTLGLAALLATAGAAVADGPVVLTDAQLDRVTAGGEALATLVINRLRGATPSPNTPDNVSIVFGPAGQGKFLDLSVRNRGTDTGVLLYDIGVRR